MNIEHIRQYFYRHNNDECIEDFQDTIKKEILKYPQNIECFNWLKSSYYTLLCNKTGNPYYLTSKEYKKLEDQATNVFVQIVEEFFQKYPITSFTPKEMTDLQNNNYTTSSVLHLYKKIGITSFSFDHWWSVFNQGDTVSAQFLYEQNCFPTQWTKTDKDNSFLHSVTSNNELKVLKALPQDFIKQYIHTVNSKGETPLHCATRELFPEYVQFLLDLGADPNAKTHKGKLPFDLIKRTKSKQNKIDDIIALIGTTNKTPRQLLKQACQTNSLGLLNKISEQHTVATVFKPEHWDCIFPLNVNQNNLKQIRKNQLAFVTALLEHDVPLLAKIDQNTVLHLAIRQGAVDCVELLLNKHPELSNVQNQFGFLPAHMNTTAPYQKVDYSLYKDCDYQHINQYVYGDTQFQIAQLFAQHNIVCDETSFPDVIREEHLVFLQQQRLRHQLTDILNAENPEKSTTKRKI